jgi:hypothetical protein
MTPRILATLAAAITLTGCTDALQPPPSRCGGPVMSAAPSSRDQAILWQQQYRRQPIAPTPTPARQPQPPARPDVWLENWGG